MVAHSGGDTQLRSDSGGDGLGGCERMFPDAENSPASAAKQPGCAPVTGSIMGNFVLPILAVSPGHAAVPTTAMPEAAINEECDTSGGENEVGVARQWLVPPPAGDVGGPQDGRQP